MITSWISPVQSSLFAYGYDWQDQKFTGKERDSESGLDYFGARYYGSALGRFTGPDPKQITAQRRFDPQQWNAYSYTRGNPLRFWDPDGKETRLAPGLTPEQRDRVVSAVALAYTKEDFRRNFTTLSDSHNTVYFGEGLIKQDNPNRIVGGVTTAKPADSAQPLSKDNVVITVTLDSKYGMGLPDQQEVNIVAHETYHAVRDNTDPAAMKKAYDDHENGGDPAPYNREENNARHAGKVSETQDGTMTYDDAKAAVEKAFTPPAQPQPKPNQQQ